MDSVIDVLRKLNRERQLLLLFLLYVKNGESIKGDIWLQKEMYLIERLADIKDKYHFLEHLKGPYSEDLAGEIDYLINLNLVERTKENAYKITPKGKSLINKLTEKNILAKLLGEKTLEIVEEVKDLLNDLSKEEVLGYIYFNYPETVKRSEEFEHIKNRKNEIIINLYKKGKISLARVAELLNIPLNKLLKIVSS